MTPIGITLPIQGGGKNGFFIQSYDTLSAKKTNILNLLMTVPGERPMNPLFGSGIHGIVFENNDDIIELVKQTIADDINMWIPGVTVGNVELNTSNPQENQSNDIYTLYVKVNFTVNNQKDSLTLTLNKTI